MNPLRASLGCDPNPIVSEFDKRNIFGNLEVIQKINVGFLAQLRDEITNRQFDACIGDVFIAHVSAPNKTLLLLFVSIIEYLSSALVG